MNPCQGWSCVLVSLAAVASAGVHVERSEQALTLRNARCRLVLDLAKGCGRVTALHFPNRGVNTVGGASLSLYFREAKHWVDESWIKASEVRVRDAEGGKAVEVEVADFGGFRLQKSVVMHGGSPVARLAYRLTATREVTPHLICPVGLSPDVSLDRLVTPGGEVRASDLKVSDFAMEVKAEWYAFRSSASGGGVVVVPLVWPEMHSVNWVGRKEDGSLRLAMRLHPMRTFSEGQTVSFAYNLVPFTGDAAAAAEVAVRAGAAEPPAAEPAVREGQDTTDLSAGLRVGYCARTTEPPTLDGKLEDACWDNAGILDRFIHMNGKAFAEGETTARIVHDGDNLYLGIRCEEPMMDQVRTDAEPGSSKVWTDDCVEVFVASPDSLRTYAHLIVNAAGVRQDNLPLERAAAYRWTAQARRGQGSWSVEVRVPFEDLALEPPAPGGFLRFNVCRSRLPKREATCWTPTFTGFHNPERFGVLAFGQPRVRAVHLAIGLEGGDAEPRVSVRMSNTSAQERDVSATLTVECEGTVLGAVVPANVRLGPGETGALEIPYETPRSGMYRLEVAARDGRDDQPIVSGALTRQVFSQGLNSAIFPAEKDGNRLCLAKGTTQHFFFVPANHSKETRPGFSFVLTLPQGVEVIQATGDVLDLYFRPTLKSRESVERDGTSMVRWVWESDRALGSRNLRKARFYRSWCGALEAADDVPEGDAPFYFGLEADGEREQEHAGQLVVMPVPRGRQPKAVVIGMSGWTISPTEDFWPKLLATYKRCGINLMDSHMQARGRQWAQPVLDAGMRSWQLMWWFWWNDAYLKAHPDHAAITAEGKPDKKRICPEVVAAADSDAIAGVMQPLVKAVQDGLIEGSWWDLEGPACFDVCFCPRCVERFREVAGVPADEELTPLKLRAKHAEQWVSFACSQSARVAARMKAHAESAGVDWKLAVYCAVQNEHTRKSYRVDWKALTPHLDVATPSFYSFGASDLGKSFTQGTADFVSLIRAIKDIPVWNTISTGYGRDSDFHRDGRLTKMQIIKSVAFGADGVCQWWWGPTDGRHYHAYAEASALISELEEFFTEGRRVHDVDVEAVDGTSHTAWRRGDQTLVMTFNDTTGEPRTVAVRVPDGSGLHRTDGGAELAADGNAIRATIAPLDCRWAVLRR